MAGIHLAVAGARSFPPRAGFIVGTAGGSPPAFIGYLEGFFGASGIRNLIDGKTFSGYYDRYVAGVYQETVFAAAGDVTGTWWNLIQLEAGPFYTRVGTGTYESSLSATLWTLHTNGPSGFPLDATVLVL